MRSRSSSSQDMVFAISPDTKDYNSGWQLAEDDEKRKLLSSPPESDQANGGKPENTEVSASKVERREAEDGVNASTNSRTEESMHSHRHESDAQNDNGEYMSECSGGGGVEENQQGKENEGQEIGRDVQNVRDGGNLEAEIQFGDTLKDSSQVYAPKAKITAEEESDEWSYVFDGSYEFDVGEEGNLDRMARSSIDRSEDLDSARPSVDRSVDFDSARPSVDRSVDFDPARPSTDRSVDFETEGQGKELIWGDDVESRQDEAGFGRQWRSLPMIPHARLSRENEGGSPLDERAFARTSRKSKVTEVAGESSASPTESWSAVRALFTNFYGENRSSGTNYVTSDLGRKASVAKKLGKSFTKLGKRPSVKARLASEAGLDVRSASSESEKLGGDSKGGILSKGKDLASESDGKIWSTANSGTLDGVSNPVGRSPARPAHVEAKDCSTESATESQHPEEMARTQGGNFEGKEGRGNVERASHGEGNPLELEEQPQLEDFQRAESTVRDVEVFAKDSAVDSNGVEVGNLEKEDASEIVAPQDGSSIGRDVVDNAEQENMRVEDERDAKGEKSAEINSPGMVSKGGGGDEAVASHEDYADSGQETDRSNEIDDNQVQMENDAEVADDVGAGGLRAEPDWINEQTEDKTQDVPLNANAQTEVERVYNKKGALESDTAAERGIADENMGEDNGKDREDGDRVHLNHEWAVSEAGSKKLGHGDELEEMYGAELADHGQGTEQGDTASIERVTGEKSKSLSEITAKQVGRGEDNTESKGKGHGAPILMAIPLILLAFGSIFVGYLTKERYRRRKQSHGSGAK